MLHAAVCHLKVVMFAFFKIVFREGYEDAVLESGNVI